jgi:cell wall-associated NlpC family hydrolase
LPDLIRFARRLDPAAGGAPLAGGERRQVTAPILDLTFAPEADAPRETQLLHGEGFVVHAEGGGFAWGQSVADGYVGHVPANGLGPPTEAKGVVTALAAHVYPEPGIKRRPLRALPFLARVAIAEEVDGFARLTGGGYLARQHLAPVQGDFVGQAERFVGIPYLWGGRSAWGLDCSALVQLALAAVGTTAPRDSDMQEALLGEAVAPDAPVLRGDLFFWRAHVGIAADAGTLLHANAHHMAVAREPLAEALARIAAAGGGPVSVRRRLAPGDRGWVPPVV